MLSSVGESHSEMYRISVKIEHVIMNTLAEIFHGDDKRRETAIEMCRQWNGGESTEWDGPPKQKKKK